MAPTSAGTFVQGRVVMAVGVMLFGAGMVAGSIPLAVCGCVLLPWRRMMKHASRAPQPPLAPGPAREPDVR